MKYPQRERRIGTSDKKKDRGMLKDPKQALDLACGQRVVDGRSKVKKYGRRGEESHTNNKPNVSTLRRSRDEKGGSDECCGETEAMANGVPNFFRSRLLTPASGMIRVPTYYAG